ncbi:V4R domain-containing protein [uncultured Marivita sp.]|uniref:V4R domain-containing protein n=1 Tax=uncultured Marivita sp. TaxID=888080 RepID=UPI000D7991F8|nr:MAG: hypothetical protein DCO97_11470 [Marivita sp. XM-24bin2]
MGPLEGYFRVLKTSALEIRNHPVTQAETSQQPVCLFQQTVLETVFSHSNDTRLRLVETKCCAAMADACSFELAMA